MNPNFVKNAVKHKGDIEIHTNMYVPETNNEEKALNVQNEKSP